MKTAGYKLQVAGYRLLVASCNWRSCDLKLVIVFIFFFSINLYSQHITQPARFEHEHKDFDHEYMVISMNENGLALVRDTEKYDDRKKKWEVVFLDTALNKIWEVDVPVNSRLSILGNEYRDGNVSLLFHIDDNNVEPLHLFKFNVAEQTWSEHEFKPDVNIQYTQFWVVKDKAILGGYLNKLPALLIFDITNSNLKFVPGFIETNFELIDMRTNSNDSFNALLIEKQSNKNKKLIIRTFDENGVMLVDDVIEIDSDKIILQAMTSSLKHDELAIIGTWSSNGMKMATGIFSVLVDPFQSQKINYYDFASLNHFLDYKKSKRAHRIKAKAQARKSEGKVPEFRANFSAVRVEETKNGFAFFGEVFDVTSNYNQRNNSGYGYYPASYFGSPYGFSSIPYRYYSNPYSNPNPFGSTSTNSTEVTMLSSALFFFNMNGTLVADESMKLPSIQLPSTAHISDFVKHDSIITILCKDEKDIIVKMITVDSVREEKTKPQLQSTDETIEHESRENSCIQTWYDHYLYVYGYQTVRDPFKKTSRQVFYVNKIDVR